MTQEDKYTQDLLADIAKIIKDLIGDGAALNVHTQKVTASLSSLGRILIESNNAYKRDAQSIRGQKSLLKEEGKIKKELNDQTSAHIKLRSNENLKLEQIHGEQVRRNIELRHSLANTVTGLTQFTNAFRGIGFQSGIGMAFKNMTSPFIASHQMKREQSQVGELDDELTALGRKRFGKTGKMLKTYMKHARNEGSTTEKWIEEQTFDKARTQMDYKELLSEYNTIQRAKEGKEAGLKESPLFAQLRDHPALAKMVGVTERIAKWADENKTGIAISIMSMGIFIGLFKKMFDASPMMGKMWDLGKLMFDLILRPFGDMLGFFMLPVLKGIMLLVLPWFSKVYPKMVEWGLELGNQLTSTETIAEGVWKIVSILGSGFVQLLKAPFGLAGDSSEDMTSGALAMGATFAAPAAALVGAWGLNKVRHKLWQKPVVDPLKAGSGFKKSNTGFDADGAGKAPKSAWGKLVEKLNSFKGRVGAGRVSGVVGGAELVGMGMDLAAHMLMDDEQYEKWSKHHEENSIWGDRFWEKNNPSTMEAMSVGDINLNYYGINNSIAEHISEETVPETLHEIERLANARIS